MKSYSILSLILILSGIVLAKDDNSFFNLDSGNIQCLLTAKKYGTCVYQMTDLEEADIASVCVKFEDKQCKEFVKDVYKTTTGCENQSDKTLDSLIRRIRYVYIAGCSKDENGKPCPLTNLIQQRQNAYNTSDVDVSIVQDSCNSSNCKKQLHNMIELLPSTKPYIENKNTNSTQDIPDEWIDATYNNIDTDKIKELLESEVCSKMINATNAAANSTEFASNTTGNVSNSPEIKADSKNSSAANIISSNANLIFVTILLVTVMNFIF